MLLKSQNSEAFGKHRPFLLQFFFYEHFNRQFTYAVFYERFNRQFTYAIFYERFNRQFTYATLCIQNRKMCLSKKILYEYFVAFFCPG